MKRHEAELLDRMLPLSPAERLYANRMIILSGCSAYRAAWEARQNTGLGRGHDLQAVGRTLTYGRMIGPDVRRIPIRHLDRINIKREARGLAPVRHAGPDDNAPHARCTAWRYF